MRRTFFMFCLLTISGLFACPSSGNPHVVEKPAKATAIFLRVMSDGNVQWNGKKISATNLDRLFQEFAAQKPAPEIHFIVDKKAKYEDVAKVLRSAQRTGLNIGFTGIETSN